MQEVFLEIWRAAARFEGRAAARTWIFGIARNKAVDRVRRGARLVLAEPDARPARRCAGPGGGRGGGQRRRAGPRLYRATERRPSLGDPSGVLPGAPLRRDRRDRRRAGRHDQDAHPARQAPADALPRGIQDRLIGGSSVRLHAFDDVRGLEPGKSGIARRVVGEAELPEADRARPVADPRADLRSSARIAASRRRRREGHRERRAAGGLLRHRRVSGLAARAGKEGHGDHLPDQDGRGGRGRERPEARPTRRAGRAGFGVDRPRQPRPPELSRSRSARLRVGGGGDSADQRDLGREVRPPGRFGRDPGGLGLRQPCRGRRRPASRRSDSSGSSATARCPSISRTRRLRLPGVPSDGRCLANSWSRHAIMRFKLRRKL